MKLINYFEDLFLKIYEFISLRGINKTDSDREKDYKIIINRYLTLTAIIFLIHGFSNFIYLGFTKEGFFLLFIFLIFISLSLFLTKFRTNNYFISFIFCILSAIITYFSSFCGIKSGVFLFYFPLLTALPIFFNFKEDKFIFYSLIFIIIISFYISAINDFKLVEINKKLNGYEHALFIINITCMILFLIVNFIFLEEKRNNYYYSLNKNVSKKQMIENLNKELNHLKEIQNKEDISVENLQELIDSLQLNDSIFVDKLSKLFPDFLEKVKLQSSSKLNVSDLKYCGMLKLGFTTKQIALYTNSSIKSVESKKYRLRKKLSIPLEEDSKLWFLNI